MATDTRVVDRRAQAATDNAILRKYAAGGDLKQIAADLSVPLDRVTDIVSAVSFQRGRAAELVREREATLLRRNDTPPPAPAPPAPRQEPTVQPQPDTIEHVLTRAEATGKPRLTQLAGRIRTLTDELRRNLQDTAKVLEAEARIERAKAELAAATDQLKALTRPSVPASVASSSEPTAKDVRAWAASNGVACPVSGRVPKDVVAKYLASTKGTTA